MHIPSHKAALSNLCASLDGTTEAIALSLLADARNAKDSGRNPFLEHDRIREIRQLPPEETFDLVTDGHHFIAEGVVVHNCDIEINNRLEKLGYSFAGIKPWKDASLGDMVAEDIYDLLVKDPSKCPQSGDSWSGEDGTGDMAGDESGDVSPADRQKILEMVSYAHAVAKLAGGKVDPRIGELLDKFLQPKIDWRNRFRALMRPYRAKKRSWQFRNRRYTAILPSNKGKVKQLDHIVFFIDVSGSITTEQARRFITEVKKAQQDYEPRKLTIVQFDTDIVRVDEFKKNDKLDKLQIIGRGGTHLQCVTDWLNEHKPELAVLFSDMYCDPMVEPEVTKMIFIVQDNPRFSSFGFGSVIHVQD